MINCFVINRQPLFIDISYRPYPLTPPSPPAPPEGSDDPERRVHPVARLARPRAARRGRLPGVRRGERHGGGRQA